MSDPKPNREKETLKKSMIRRLGQLKNERSSFDSHWKSIAQVTSPRSARFFTSERNRGERRNQDIYDETAVYALRTLQSGMGAGMTSPARPWFKLKLGDKKLMEVQSVKLWLNDAETAIRDCFNKSNLYQSLAGVYLQSGAFGTSVMLILEDDEDDIRCHTLPIGSYCIATDGKGRVNSIYREYSMTVGQLVDDFGFENCSDAVRASYESNNLDAWVDVLHVIEPNDGRDSTKLDNKNMPFRSVRIEKGGQSEDDRYLSFTGFREFPAIAPRWEVTGEDVYATSCPGMIALPSILMLQRAVKLYDKICNKIADPPLKADVMLRNEITSMLPGGITYISGLGTAAGAGVAPIHEISPVVLGPLSEKIADLQQKIRRAFFEDMMQMFATSDVNDMTAREVEERHQEKLLVLGPVMERFDDEAFDAAINRTFRILERRGKIPKPPPEMQGYPVVIENVSVMASAMKMVGTASVDRLLSFVGNLIAVFPQAADKIDVDVAIEEYADMLGSPPKILKPGESVDKIRSARAQAQQKQAQAEQMATMAPALQQGADAARLLSETGVGESTALNRLLGQ